MTHNGFHEPAKLLPLLDTFDAPWCVAGGWALDLYLGRLTRPHEDLEIAILRHDQHRLRKHLQGWHFYKVIQRTGGGARVPWSAHEQLELPVHEIHAHHPKNPIGELEILLNESGDGSWHYRRNPSVSLPLDRVWQRSSSGIPFLAPEVVLLYKSKSPRARDTVDFHSTLPALEPGARAWLREAIAASHATCPWLSSL